MFNTEKRYGNKISIIIIINYLSEYKLLFMISGTSFYLFKNLNYIRVIKNNQPANKQRTIQRYVENHKKFGSLCSYSYLIYPVVWLTVGAPL